MGNGRGFTGEAQIVLRFYFIYFNCDLRITYGWQDSLVVYALVSEPSSLGLNVSPAINCHCGVSQAVKGRHQCLFCPTEGR